MTPVPRAVDAVDCEFHGEHGRIDERLEQLEGRAEKHDASLEKLGAGQAGIREEIAGMRGELRGALAASKMSGAVVTGLISFGGTALLGVLGWLAARK